MVLPRVNVPSSCASTKTAAISSRASVRELKPPVSTSTTTGRKPRKRSQIAKGFIERTLSDRNPECRTANLSLVGRFRQLLVQDQVQRQADTEAGNVRCDGSESALAFRGAQVHVDPGNVAVDKFVQERRGEDVVASCVRRALLDVRDVALQLGQEFFPLRKRPDALT